MSMVIPHHYPTSLSEKMYNTLLEHGSMSARELGEMLGYTAPEIVSECMNDKRLHHNFYKDQNYYIEPLVETE